MGNSISWLAAHGEADAVKRELGLIGTAKEKTREIYLGGKLQSGWYVVKVRGCDHAIIHPTVLAKLSSQFDVMACSVEEHVMYCGAWFWSRGKLIWAVKHESEKAFDHLETTGELPPFFTEIRDRALSDQESQSEPERVDFVFEIPTQLAERVTGYNLDTEADDIAFEELAWKSTRDKPWWRVW